LHFKDPQQPPVEGTQEGLMSLVPLNLRVFLRNAFRDESDVGSLISAKDLSAAEVEEVYRRIEEQDAKNARDERRYTNVVSEYEKRLNQYPLTAWGREGIMSGIDIADTYDYTEHEWTSSNPDAVFGKSELSDEERYQRNLDVFNDKTQAQLDNARLEAESYERTRGKTSVDFDPEVGGYGSGPGLIETIKKSFTSPAYNINTTLGRFNAFKNEDGTVTISDTYNWTNQANDPARRDMSLKAFLRALPTMVHKPEALGNVLMRTLFDEKYSPVEFTLPPRGIAAER
jgi:hypothetical protein